MKALKVALTQHGSDFIKDEADAWRVLGMAQSLYLPDEDIDESGGTVEKNCLIQIGAKNVRYSNP